MTGATATKFEVVSLLLIIGSSVFYWRSMFGGDDEEGATAPSLVSWPVWTFISAFGVWSAWKGHFGFNVVISVVYMMIMLITSVLAGSDLSKMSRYSWLPGGNAYGALVRGKSGLLAGDAWEKLGKWDYLFGGLAVVGATVWGFGLVSGNLGVALIVAADLCAWIPTLIGCLNGTSREPAGPWFVSGIGGIIGGFAIERTSFVAFAYPYYVIASVVITSLVLVWRKETLRYRKGLAA